MLAASIAELARHAAEPDKHDGLKISEVTIKINRSANEFTFELSAFFAAIRSAIDFIVRVCVIHTKSIKQADSIRTFLKLVADGKTGPILEIVCRHSGWLQHLRSYRDHLIHYLVISVVSGGQNTWKQGISVSALYPIVVPSETPRHMPDTRLARALDEPESRFMISTSETVITDPVEGRRLVERRVQMDPAPGYVRIEDLMKREIEAFEKFFGEIIDELIGLDFGPAAVIDPQR
jgi:hypothetical protein